MTPLPGAIDPQSIRQIGRYPVRRYLASGGMSWVFEVEDGVLGVTRALKLLKPEAAEGEELTRFANEARIIARFNHPNLFTVYDFGKDEGTGCFFYTMNLVEGVTFGELEVVASSDSDATRHAGVSCGVAEVCGYFVQVLDALARLHAEGIIHRDIKPRNVFLQRDRFGEPRPMLGDLGVARIEGVKSEVTRAGYTVGTPLYMAPEQVRGSAVGPTSDVFSCGLTLYRVLTGRTVYDDVKDLDSSNASQVLGHLGGLLMSGKEFEFRFPALVPEPLRRVIRRACRMNPRERYADAQALRSALEDARTELAAAGVGRRRGRMALAAGAALVVALLAIGGFWLFAGSRRPRIEDAALADRIASARDLRADATALVELVESAPERPEALAVRAREALGLANQTLAAAEQQFAAADAAGASAAQQRASLGYDALCARLANGFLVPRVVARTSHLRELRARIAASPLATGAQRAAQAGDSAGEAAPADVSDCAGAKALVQREGERAAVETELAKLDAELAASERTVQEEEAARVRAARAAELAARKAAAVAATPKSPAAGAAVAAAEAAPAAQHAKTQTAPTSEASDEQQVRAMITHWCSAANRGDTLEMLKRANMDDATRATFDKRTVGFDEQRCRIQSLEADGGGYLVSVPIEQIQKDGAMSNIMRQFIARLRVAREGDAWHIESIQGAEP